MGSCVPPPKPPASARRSITTACSWAAHARLVRGSNSNRLSATAVTECAGADRSPLHLDLGKSVARSGDLVAGRTELVALVDASSTRIVLLDVKAHRARIAPGRPSHDPANQPTRPPPPP